MPRHLSMPNLLAAVLFCVSLQLQAGIPVTAIRQPGAPLDPSLRNEADHAADLAASWLAAHQGADGSWGSETDRVWRTSITLLALTARANLYSDACARAAVWLDSHVPAAEEGPGAYAWRAIALLSIVPDASARAKLAQRLFQESRAYVQPTNAPFFKRALWDDARALAGGPPAPPPEKETARELSALAVNAQRLSGGSPCRSWFDVRLINRASQGNLERDGKPLDWRRAVAENLVNTQRRDPAGGGFWVAPTADSEIAETAFGLLTLLEL